MKLPSGASTEQRPEMAKRSEEVLMASRTDVHQNCETSQQTPQEKQHMTTTTETQVTEKQIQTQSGTAVTQQPLDKAPRDQTSSKASTSGVKVKPATLRHG